MVDVLNLVLAIMGVVLGLVAVPAAWRECQKRRWHVLDVSAHVEPHWAPAPGEENTDVRVGGTLTLENRGVHPVTNVHVLRPEALSLHPSTYRPVILPGERVEIQLTAQQMSALPDDALVELQVIDHRGHGWSWTPEARYVDGASGKRVGLKPLADRRPWWTRLPGGTGFYVRRVEKRRDQAVEQRRSGP